MSKQLALDLFVGGAFLIGCVLSWAPLILLAWPFL
jgi:hypothetical protein